MTTLGSARGARWSVEANHRRRWASLAVLCLSLLLIVAGLSSLNVALPDIQRALGSGPSAVLWIVDLYSLVFAALLLPAGALADRFGRKTALQVGLVIFGVASLAATVADATWQLVLWRAVMGAGAAFVMPGTLSILTNVFTDPTERRRAIAIWAGVAGLGGAIGPVVSGLLLTHFWWGSIFFINVAIVVVALAAGFFLLPNSADPHDSNLDPLGEVLAVAGLASVLYGIIEGPTQGWGSPTITVALLAGVVLLAGFVLWELRTATPMLDVRLFAVRPFQVGSLTITLQFFAMYGLYFAVAQYLQISHGYSPLKTALAALPIGVVGMVSAPNSARLVRRYGHRIVVAGGLAMSAFGLLLMGSASPTTAYVLLLLAFAAMGFGNGQTTAPSTTLIMGSVPRAKSGVGSAVNDLSRELGGALGIAVLGSIMASVYKGRISHGLGPVAASAGTSVTGTLDAASAAARRGDIATAHLLAQHAQTSLAHAFGVAMVVGAVVLLLNATLVWVRFRHYDDRPANSAATTQATTSPAELAGSSAAVQS